MEHLIDPGTELKRSTVAAITVVAIGALMALIGTGLVDRLFPSESYQLVDFEALELEKAERERKVRDGSYARWIEKSLATKSRTRETVAPWWTAVLMLYGKSVPETLVLGRDDWLFLRNRIEVREDPLRNGPLFAARVMSAARRRLASHGSDLRVIPLARKSVICRSMLPDHYDPHAEFDRGIIDELTRAGVPTIDTMALWSALEPREAYFPLDSHWSFQAELDLAKAIATEFPELVSGEVKAFDTPREPFETANLVVTAGVDKRHPAFGLVPRGKTTRLWLEPSELRKELADPTFESDLVLVGTSFTRDYNLHELLVVLLGRRVECRALAGMPFFSALDEFLERERNTPPPSTILYEFPIHQIEQAHRSPPAVGSVFSNRPPLSVSAVNAAPATLAKEARNRRGPLPRASFPEGSVLSSGDGPICVELTVTADAETEWLVTGSGPEMVVRFDAGGGRAWLPVLDGPEWTGAVAITSNQRGQDAAIVEARLVLDLDRTAVEGLPLTSDNASVHSHDPGTTSGRWIRDHDTLVLDWDDSPPSVTVTVAGRRKDGEPETLRWEFAAPTARTAALTLGPLRGGTIQSVRVEGPGASLQLSIGRPDLD